PPDGYIVVDRLPSELSEADRLQEALRRALAESGGAGFYLLLPREADIGDSPLNVGRMSSGHQSLLFFPARRVCAGCGAEVPPVSESLLSFNTPEGACPRCRGFGDIMYYDPDLYLDRSRTLRDNPVLAWSGESYGVYHRHLLRWAVERRIPTDVPLADLPPEVERGLMAGEGRFPGVAGFFQKLESKKYKMHVRVFLSRFRRFATCPECGGTRLHRRARSVRIQGRDIGEVATLTAMELQHLVQTLHLPTPVQAALSRVIQELEKRLHCLVRLGVGYLTLDRPTFTLSQGEAQRVHLAAVVGTGLADTLFILDEPTLGLHARDNARLADILAELCAAGNTVVCVEHDPEFIRYARHIIDLGPGAGRQGGRVAYCGPMTDFLARSDSVSARFLRGATDEPTRERAAVAPDGDFLEFRKATARNLRRITARFPCRAISCITGVSGSGKSTLLEEIVLAGVTTRLRGEDPPPQLDGVTGGLDLSFVRYMDQELPAGSARSTSLTYLDLFTPVRRLLADQDKAVLQGIVPGFFSPNVEGGRCRTCRGRGAMVLDMQFLADEEVLCEDCQGTGYSAEALQYTFQGLHIVQILQLTVGEAAVFFGDLAGLSEGLALLEKVGLGYLRLGQTLKTMSGGEIQRLKLCRTLLEHLPDRGRAGRRESAPAPTGLYLFDEPTTGLHPADTCRLLVVLEELRQAGHTVIVVEHDLFFLDHADWVVDLGPEGGEDGGLVVYQGAVTGLLDHPLSHTGQALARWRSARQARVTGG
ncbi:MAG: excinuclease ABC subunit A, partial [Acidobacteria bacterium]|nr:excinuclease ABC subunit A [Acidobacteriota bacterium]